MLVIASFSILPSIFENNDVIDGKYKYHISGSEVDVEWPWEYKTNAEKYHSVVFDGRIYSIKSLNMITADILGETLGDCEAEGIDSYTEQKYNETFEVRKINGVSEEKLIAVGNDTGFYVYSLDDNEKPSTFGEMLDLYGLTQTISFERFTKYEGYDERGISH